MIIYTVFTFLKVLAKFKEWRGSQHLLGRIFKTQSTISHSCVKCGTRVNEVMKWKRNRYFTLPCDKYCNNESAAVFLTSIELCN